MVGTLCFAAGANAQGTGDGATRTFQEDAIRDHVLRYPLEEWVAGTHREVFFISSNGEKRSGQGLFSALTKSRG